GQHLVAAPDLRDHLDVELELEQRRERLAHHRLVLGDEDADHASGTSTRRRKPPPSGSGPASTEPPRRLARSRRPARPRPPSSPSAPLPLSTISTAAFGPPPATTMRAIDAPEWRSTLVVPSRTVHASSSSTSSGRST